MLIDLTNLDGSTRTIESKSIFRFRTSFGAGEPSGATTVDASSGRLFVRDDVAAVTALLGADFKLVELHAPTGQSVFLDAAKVTDIQTPNNQAPPAARALVIISGKRQYVTETPKDVRGALKAVISP